MLPAAALSALTLVHSRVAVSSSLVRPQGCVPLPLSSAGAVFGHVFVLAEDFHGTHYPTSVVLWLLICSLWVCGIRIGHATVLRRWTGDSSLRQHRNGRVRRMSLLELSTPRASFLTIICLLLRCTLHRVQL